MPDTPSDIREKNEKIPKKGGALDKYKWWIVGGLAVIAVAVFYFTNKSNQNAAQSTQTGTQPGIDPNTGLPYSQEMGMGGFGGMGGFFPYGGGGPGGRGGRGPAGPPGPRGPRGRRGRGDWREDHPHRHWKNSFGATNTSGAANVQARAAHNQRIMPAGMRIGPGM